MDHVKVCDKHGALNLDQVRHKRNIYNKKIYYECLECCREQSRAWSKKNRARINERRKQSYVSTRKILPEGFVKKCKYHGLLTIDQVKTPGEGVKHSCLECLKIQNIASDKYKRKQTQELDDGYVIRLLRDSGRKNVRKLNKVLTQEDFKQMPELIELKRISLQIKRQLRYRREQEDIENPKPPCTFEHSKQNIRKAQAASAQKRKARTHCAKGHPFNEKRKCPICNTEHKRRRMGHLPREIASKVIVENKCSGCGAILMVSKLGARKDQKCVDCKKEYMRNYDANRKEAKRAQYLKRKMMLDARK